MKQNAGIKRKGTSEDINFNEAGLCDLYIYLSINQ